MDFARKILHKYGWKDGIGLGKNNDGIAKPLKATLKFDNVGFGADQAATDFNNHWWERVFNDAANNVNIRREGEEIKVDLKNSEDGVEISTKGYSMKKLKKAKQSRGKTGVEENSYDNFLQSATLTNLGDEIDNPGKIDFTDIEVSKLTVLTDEELFKACGGRTAHKAARHGLKLNGKLSRIEQQDSELLAKITGKSSSNVIAVQTKLETGAINLMNSENDGDDFLEPRKKKNKKKIRQTYEMHERKREENDKLIKQIHKSCAEKVSEDAVNPEFIVCKRKRKERKVFEDKHCDTITLNKKLLTTENDQKTSIKNKRKKKDKNVE